MCTDCGCGQAEPAVLQVSPPAMEPIRSLDVHEGLLSKNNRLAQHNRQRCQAHRLLVLNVLSSPGSGKTTLIGQTAHTWPHPQQVGVIVGDLATENDAQRLRQAGATALQITTGTTCHLDAHMVAHALDHFNLANLAILIIENVGNLVCPAAYDLGETLRVVLLSVTEGEDKPEKYPTAFQSAHLVVLTKTDIADAVGFKRERAIATLHRMAPQAQILELSARTGTGMATWQHYLQQHMTQQRGTEAVAP